MTDVRTGEYFFIGEFSNELNAIRLAGKRKESDHEAIQAAERPACTGPRAGSVRFAARCNKCDERR